VIRFSVFLVAVGLGLLVAGVVTSRLMLVYVAIGVSGVALLALGVGALIKRDELFGQDRSAEPKPPEPGLARAEQAGGFVPSAQPEPQVAPWEVAVPADSAWPAAAQPAPSRAGYLPTETPLTPQPLPNQPLPNQPLPNQPLPNQPLPTQPVKAQPDYPLPAEHPAQHLAERPTDARGPAAFTPGPSAGAPSPPAPGVPASALGAWEWRADAPAAQPFPEIRRPEPPVPAAPDPDEPPRAAGSQPPAQDQPPSAPDRPAAQAEPPAQDRQQEDLIPEAQLPAERAPAAEQALPPTQDLRGTVDQPPDSDGDQQTQQLPVAGSTATEPAVSQPDAAAPESAAEPAAPAAPGAAAALAAPATAATSAAPATIDLQREVTVVPGVPRYHNPHCLLIRFMGQDDLDTMTLGAARELRCTPCRACLPDLPESNPG
jgi:hypothetical protein